MKVLSISAAGLFALSLAACSPAGDDAQTPATTADSSATTTMPPADSTMMPPADGTMSGSTGTTTDGSMTGTTGTNPDGTPITPTPDGQTTDMNNGTPGTTPPVQ